MTAGIATRTVPTPAGDVAVDVAGGPDDAPVLLCLHGIGSSASAFAHVLDRPPPGWRVVAWDAPGYARSADPAAAPGMDGYADAAAAVVRAVTGHRTVPAVAALGVSWGGVVATRLALRHPALVDALVLVASSVGSGADPERARAMRARADDLARSGPARFAAERGPRLLSAAAPDTLRDAVVGAMARAGRLPGYRWAAEAMAATDHTGRLAEITVPVLVVAGTADRVTGPPAAERLHERLPDAALHLVEGAGHLVNQERPHELDALLHPFLTANHPTPAPTPEAPR